MMVSILLRLQFLRKMGVYFSHTKSKSGSYFTDFYFLYDSYITIVEPKEKIIITYEPVKKDEN